VCRALCSQAAERVLVFQTDSLICRRGVDEFSAYDYVGAPWRLDQEWNHGSPWLAHAGNGGFSLRRRSIALAMLDAIDYSRGEAEDMFFAEHIPRVGGQIASRQAAAQFAVEATDESPPEPFGFRACAAALHPVRPHCTHTHSTLCAMCCAADSDAFGAVTRRRGAEVPDA
jgi:hypothetical protein